jgi:hypothetical protein
MATIRERGPWNHKGPRNGQTPLMETNTLRIGIPTMIVAQKRKMDGNGLWNHIERVYKAVAKTYFYGNYPGTWSMDTQRTWEWSNPIDGNKYTHKLYTNNDCGTKYNQINQQILTGIGRGLQTINQQEKQQFIRL